MAKKRKKPASRATAKAAAAQTPAARESAALQALEAGRYRDAIAELKTLLKEDAASERSQARRLALADAYAGRARELSDKGMLKEALVLWENRAALGPEVAPALEHSLLCLRLGDHEPALRQWSQGEALSREVRERIGEQLAAAVLAGAESLLERLAAEDLVRRHAAPARAALDAYCAGDAEALEAALGQLPFRSPYRTWALLLKALARAEREPEAAREMLKRIDDDSAFAPLRRAAEMALLEDTDLLHAIIHAGPRQAELAAQLRGWSPQHLKLARDLAAIEMDASPTKAPSPQALQRVLQRYRDQLGADWVQQAWLRLLPPITEPWSRRPKGWNALSEPERALVEAWNAEAHHNAYGWDLSEVWESFAMALADEPDTGPDQERSQERSLAIALALRRFDARLRVLETEQPDTDPDSPETIAARQLERSLEWDPDHRETYLRLIRWYRRADRLKDARRILSAAQARWPRDMAVLEAAMQTALASNAFKKAAGLARQMLTIDPINHSVRQQLVNAHLRHAAKQIRHRRGDLAIKEVGEARGWVGRGAGLENLRARLGWIDGVLQMLYVEREAGRARLLEQLQHRGEGMLGRVELMLAIDLLGLRQDQIAKLLDWRAGKVREPDDLRAIIAQLRDFREQTDRFTVGLVEQLQLLLKGAPWKRLERAELELACETLSRMQLGDARQEAARAALKRWPRTPVFEYHLYDAKYAKGGRPSTKELDRMQAALMQAQEAGDMRAANQLQGLIQEFLPFGGLPIPGLDPDFDLDEDDEDGPAIDLSAVLAGMLGLDRLLDALRRKPLKRALEEANMPPFLRDHFLEMAREEGEDVVVEVLEEIALKATGERKRKSKQHPFNFDLF
ncbi:MAG: hypothetical protein ACLFS2_01695 [Halochromatium sp.]|uniref:hypothetical protein n=1 Tax=Halochromatium sp. TaxID=2049430 RepID=UPI0039788E4E